MSESETKQASDAESKPTLEATESEPTSTVEVTASKAAEESVFPNDTPAQTGASMGVKHTKLLQKSFFSNTSLGSLCNR